MGVAPLSHLDTPGAKSFIKLYKKNHENVPTAETAYNYFAMFLVARAMERAGTVTNVADIRAAIPQALKQIDEAHNPFAVTSMTDDGNLAIDVRIAEVTDGQVKILQRSDMDLD